MTTRTKEEERLLDEKIARIQKQNDEILRRRREIEEDKRMAERQNAVVKLKPVNTNDSRERTPALKPSNREFQEDYSSRDHPEHARNVRPSRGRGAELYRRTSEHSDKASGPPPDPKSFLYDEERDPVMKERDNKPERRTREEHWNSRGGGSDSREFSRSGRRGNMVGRRGGGRGRSGGRSEEEEEWRAERKRVDEARIQRQRAADGRWRREWDNEKLDDSLEEPQYEQRHSPPRYQEHSHHHHQHHSPHHHHHSPHHHHHEGEHTSSPELSPRKPFRPAGVSRGRGRGRLNPSELEMDFVHLDCLVNPPNLPDNSSSSPGFVLRGIALRNLPDNSSSSPGFVPRGIAAVSPTSSSQDDLPMDPNRTVQCVGSNFKISVPNSGNPRTQRQAQGGRGRFRSQRNYSSQSEDDSPQDRGQSVRRQRQQRYPGRTAQQGSSGSRPRDTQDSKPPLPPTKTERPPSSVERNDDDGSWEDITTSGNESMGEDHSSANSSPEKKGVKSTVSLVVNRLDYDVQINKGFMEKEPSCYPFDEYLEKCCSVDGSVNLDTSFNSDVLEKSNLKNLKDDIVSGITRIENGQPNLAANSKKHESCIIEQENEEKNDCPPAINKEIVSNETTTIEEDIVQEKAIHPVNKNEELTSSNGNENNVPKTNAFREGNSESLEEKETNLSDSTEINSTTSESHENVDLTTDNDKEQNKDEDSKSESKNDLVTQDTKGNEGQIKT